MPSRNVELLEQILSFIFCNFIIVKKNILLITLFLLCLQSVAQQLAVSIDKNNFFYCGAINPITVLVENTAPTNIKLETNNGLITGSNGHYNYTPTRLGSAQIIIKRKKKNQYVEIGRNNYRVLKIPDPVALVGPAMHVTRSPIKAQDYIRAELLNFDFDVRFVVDSFVFYVKRLNGTATNEIFNYGQAFNEHVKNTLQNTITGDTLIFDKIYAHGPDSITRNLAPLEIVVYQ